MTDSPAFLQRERCFDYFADERSFPPCFARLTIPSHTECTNRFGGPCHPRDLECAHLVPASQLRNRIRGLKQSRNMNGHPLTQTPEDEIIYDPRIAVALCPGSHHSWDQTGTRCSYEDLPEQAKEWAQDYWLDHWLRELYPSSDEMELAA